MQTKDIRSICAERGLYDTPELNSRLLLHRVGISCIPDLACYRNIRCLYLNNNNLSCIRNLSSIIDLQTLYIQV